jgi:hypothetical protein
VTNHLETSTLLREITKARNKLQLMHLRLAAQMPWTGPLPIWELEDFEELVTAFPRLQELAIDIDLAGENWVIFGNLHLVDG